MLQGNCTCYITYRQLGMPGDAGDATQHAPERSSSQGQSAAAQSTSPLESMGETVPIDEDTGRGSPAETQPLDIPPETVAGSTSPAAVRTSAIIDAQCATRCMLTLGSHIACRSGDRMHRSRSHVDLLSAAGRI